MAQCIPLEIIPGFSEARLSKTDDSNIPVNTKFYWKVDTDILTQNLAAHDLQLLLLSGLHFL